MHIYAHACYPPSPLSLLVHMQVQVRCWCSCISFINLLTRLDSEKHLLHHRIHELLQRLRCQPHIDG